MKKKRKKKVESKRAGKACYIAVPLARAPLLPGAVGLSLQANAGLVPCGWRQFLGLAEITNAIPVTQLRAKSESKLSHVMQLRYTLHTA